MPCDCFRDMACSVAGITSDANVLTNELRLIAQRLVHILFVSLILLPLMGVINGMGLFNS